MGRLSEFMLRGQSPAETPVTDFMLAGESDPSQVDTTLNGKSDPSKIEAGGLNAELKKQSLAPPGPAVLFPGQTPIIGTEDKNPFPSSDPETNYPGRTPVIGTENATNNPLSSTVVPATFAQGEGVDASEIHQIGATIAGLPNQELKPWGDG